MLDLLKKSSFFILIGIVFLLFLFFTREGDFNEQDAALTTVVSSENIISDEVSPESEPSDSVVVDVKGGVVNPGVYEIRADRRVNDVIEKAGGFTEDADQTTVNLAQKVHDEMIILIPKTGESGENVNVTGPITDSGKVRINAASKEEIESLSGIGPSKAEAIIQHRDEQGYFQTIEDLLEVSGIGEKTLENIMDEIQVP